VVLLNVRRASGDPLGKRLRPFGRRNIGSPGPRERGRLVARSLKRIDPLGHKESGSADLERRHSHEVKEQTGGHLLEVSGQPNELSRSVVEDKDEAKGPRLEILCERRAELVGVDQGLLVDGAEDPCDTRGLQSPQGREVAGGLKLVALSTTDRGEVGRGSPTPSDAGKWGVL